MKKSLLKDILERAKINDIRVNFFYFIIEVYLDTIKYKFCYNFNYNDNAKKNDFYVISDEVQSDDFEVSRFQFVKMCNEVLKFGFSYKQILKTFNFKYSEKKY